jgi:5-methylcytosine-specific restriction endonuclease McrA
MTISKELRERVRRDAKNRCGYCLCPQRLIMARLTVDHIHPVAKDGTDDEANLWLACPICNGHKADKVDEIDPETGNRVKLFNPRTQNWFEHFTWSEDGIKVVGLTPTGRVTVIALHLDSDVDALATREAWVSVRWHPPTE